MAGIYGRYLNLPEHRIVIGVPGSGKTTYAWDLARSATRVVIFDPTGDYEQIVSHARIVKPGDLQDRSILFGKGKNRAIRIIVEGMKDENVDVSDEFCYVYERCREARDLVLIGDEVFLYKKEKALRALAALHMNGHKWGIVSVLISQRAVGIPLDCRATATNVHSFLQDHSKDLDALREEYGTEFAERVEKWNPGEPPVTWQRRTLYR